ncbi:DUF4947 domain-containing protein [Candidatus Enterococcus murrayae]|uniref:DUF4947 domain-containing protein n=1 Tax=Candidatus Enterococcus murrayae TaxID=2815321 RepID=A0ABS3HFL1_9ENTE|nr:DUF4947 domain-containing protein [Enterococcus sp. MJM16]MBO0451739.1 DUF4947 domain-containing protein [Enterococcus sp. MJM16]
MKGLVCKYCGGNRFNKAREGYECTYCHTVYELESEDELGQNTALRKKPPIIRITLLVIFILFLTSSILISASREKASVKKNPSFNITKNNSSKKAGYSAGQLSNPERNIRIAELSLNQKAIEQAKASIKEYGGENTKEFEARLIKAQTEHDSAKNNRTKTPPKADMIIENPNSEFAVTTYYREAGFLTAFGPDFNQYSASDIIRIWGQPDEIITDSEQIRKNLALEFDKEDNPVNHEAKMLREQWLQGQLTWREVRTFIAINQDSTYGDYSKQFVYEKQGKPNVYFSNNQIEYVTPIVRYVSFTRLPEKYPRAGLGKYPDDFPENYGSDGLYHEK